ncbi:hypothetical protein H0H93_014512 [Arthromyces matolae]|nr:hypothetical protein H0H93_014512 [Arthromyces matolae]
MVFVAPFLAIVALFSVVTSALPRPDGNGVVIASQSSTSSAAVATDSSSYGSSNSDSSYGSTSSDSASSYGSNSDSSYLATSTYSASSSYSTPTYGSGSSNWGNSGYDDCVSQCIAEFGSPDSSYAPTATSGSMGSTGTGATHTVIVAPSQGVLRYVPFAVNASVGDTIQFMWGANNHTVTKSSELTPCNKTSDALFASGTQNQDFVFTQVVNDTNPVFFYCGTPGHCQKGMFGIINPPSAFGAPTSVSGSMQALAANNSDLAAYASYTTQQTTNNLAAGKWGGNIDLSALPDWAHAVAAENVLYTRNFLAANGEVLQEDGSVDLSSASSTPLMIPQDFSAALSNAAVVPSSSTGSSAAATSESASPSGATTVGNGASSLASPKAFVALFVILSTFFAL